MKLKMSSITDEEIQESAKRASEATETLIMYLQNNGIENFRWNLKDFVLWFQQNMDE